MSDAQTKLDANAQMKYDLGRGSFNSAQLDLGRSSASGTGRDVFQVSYQHMATGDQFSGALDFGVGKNRMKLNGAMQRPDGHINKARLEVSSNEEGNSWAGALQYKRGENISLTGKYAGEEAYFGGLLDFGFERNRINRAVLNGGYLPTAPESYAAFAAAWIIKKRWIRSTMTPSHPRARHQAGCRVPVH